MRSNDLARARIFLVAWRNTRLRKTSAVGVLRAEHGVYRFGYLDTAPSVPGFQPFLGFPDFGRTYVSTNLWPFFTVRIMDRRRPDYVDYVSALGLPRDASQLDVLSRSGGERKGDSVQVVEQPFIGEGGETSCVFLVRGTRYAVEAFGHSSVLEDLRPGDRLTVAPDASNPINGMALFVVAGDGTRLGWVPDVLIPYVNEASRSDWSLSVLQNNGEGFPWHMRLLVELRGIVSPTYDPFGDRGVAEVVGESAR